MLPRRAAAAVSLAALALATVAAANEPRRVVSLNLCTDALLADLVPRERIASVTHLGVDPRYSPRAAALGTVAVNRGGADEVLAFGPDLVVAGQYGASATVSLLRRLGIAVATVDVASSLAQARAQIQALADVLAVPHRGRELVARLDAGLAAAQPAPSARRPLAALLRPNGFTAGPQTLAGDLLAFTGFDNVAERVGIEGWGFIGLEALIAAGPQAIILEGGAAEAPSLAVALLDHPALRAHGLAVRRVTLPGNLLGCAGPWLADAAARLAEIREGLRAR